MFQFRSTPFLRLLPPFSLGVVAAGHFKLAWDPLWLCLGLIVVLLSAAAVAPAFGYRFRWLPGAVLIVFLVFCGWLRGYFDDALRRPDHFVHLPNPGPYWIAVVADAPVPAKRLKTPVRLLFNARALNAGPGTAVGGRAMVFISRNEVVDSLRYGDTLLLRAALLPASRPGNPHAFDYARYLLHKDIHHVAYVHADSVVVLGRNDGAGLWRIAFDQRSKLLDLLTRYFPDNASHAVAAALLVGYKEDLPDELEQAYINTGSMHALAVSGTHVGFVYAGLFLFFRQLRLNGRWRRVVETVGVLTGVWAFTLLTGASASVLRAAWMFSLYILGRALFRNSSVWNTLACSAFVLLWIDPDYLFDAGFQLSYAAVAGMVFFYPLLYKRIPPLPRLVDQAVQVLLVGVAAQLGTLPMSLFYFHQFPVYFWLAGWVVVLGGAVFLWGGALLVVLDSLWPWAAVMTGKLLYGVVWIMNTSVNAIQYLPGSVLDGIWLPAWAAWTLYGVLALVGAAAILGKGRLLVQALILLAILCVFRFGREEKRLRQNAIFVYQAGRANLLDVVCGRERFTWSDSISAKQETFAAQANRWALGLRRATTLSTDAPFSSRDLVWTPPVLRLSGRQMVLIDADAPESLLMGDMPPGTDTVFWWLLDTPDFSPETVLARQKPHVLIIGGGVRRKDADVWEGAAMQAGVGCHRVARDGGWGVPARRRMHPFTHG